MAHVTKDTYVNIAAYDLATGNGYNDHIVGQDGRLHAQGSHDLNLLDHPRSERATWHKIQRDRKRQYRRSTRQSVHQHRNVKHAYVQTGPRTWAVNALVDRNTGDIIRCDGYTSTRPKPRRKASSALGRAARC